MYDPVALVELAIAMRSLGVRLNPETYKKVLQVLDLAVPPMQILEAMDQAYVERILEAARAGAVVSAKPSAPVIVSEESTKTPQKKPVAAIDTSELFDL